MASYQLFLSFLVIFQFVNNSLAYYEGDRSDVNENEIKIYTPSLGYNSDRNYQYRETSHTNCLSFKIKAEKDAHIALASAPNRLDPWYEIVIGGWGNSKSVIRRNETDYEQPNVPLSENEYKGFWITWNDDGEIRVGREYDSEPFMSFNDPDPVDIEYYAVSLTWGTSGSWIIQEPSCPNLPKKVRYQHSMSGASSIFESSIFFTSFMLLFSIFKFY